MKARIAEDEAVEVQMAPLIDCVFLLLIFFLVATTLKKIDEELPITLADAENTIQTQQPEGFSAISIDAEGNFYLDGTPISIGMLQADLEKKAATNPDVKLRLDVDEATPFRRVMQVLDLLRFYDLDNVAFNTRYPTGQRTYRVE